ncbi:hypothetical protein Ahy_B05g075556 [Arachis hypogaea]|uniref:Uncharacterized protein n=1 Tax=Arachis hypogaea TaxID=3818 RepID=A0A444Z1G2_ARAHY|nr:hypothetical protein Ahy_B05g075556 [Arachis hypogaea]
MFYSKMVAQHIFTMVKENPTICIRDMLKITLDTKRLTEKFGLQSKKSLPRYMEIGRNHTTNFLDVLDVFSLCRAFKHYKLLISIDGTYLYGKIWRYSAYGYHPRWQFKHITYYICCGRRETKEICSLMLR